MADRSKNKFDREFEEGVKAGKDGDLVQDFIHGVSKSLPDTSKEQEKLTKSFNEGYEQGRNMPSEDNSSSGSTDSSNSSSAGTSGCYLTTACVQYKGLPDNCEELTILRAFRDKFLCQTLEGACDVEKYYRIAPSIVKAIQADDNREVLLDEIFTTVTEAIAYIKDDQHMKAYEVYKTKSVELAVKYSIAHS